MKPWLSYGLKGVVVCILLSLFYVGIYYPLIEEYVAVDGQMEMSYNILPLLTGHGEILFLAFLFHDIPWSICPKTEQTCYRWAVPEQLPKEIPCIPWDSDPVTGEEVPGCCYGFHKIPSESCTAPFEMAIGLFFLSLLLALYFGMGVLYWWVRYGRIFRRKS